MDVEATEINLTNSEAFTTKPITMKQLVRIAIETKLMKCAIIDANLGEDSSPCPNYPIVKIMAIRKLIEY